MVLLTNGKSSEDKVNEVVECELQSLCVLLECRFSTKSKANECVSGSTSTNDGKFVLGLGGFEWSPDRW